MSALLESLAAGFDGDARRKAALDAVLGITAALAAAATAQPASAR